MLVDKLNLVKKNIGEACNIAGFPDVLFYKV